MLVQVGCRKISLQVKLALTMIVVFVCLYEYVLDSQCNEFREIEAALLSLKLMLLICLIVWCAFCFVLTFMHSDLPLIILLLIAVGAHFITDTPALGVLILLTSVTLSKGVRVLLDVSSRRESASTRESRIDPNDLTSIGKFLIGLLLLLAFGSWWHLDVALDFYPGTRWTGLWNNPNSYGMLMGAGVVLAIGLLARNLKSEKLKAGIDDPRTGSERQNPESGNISTERKTEIKKQKLLFASIKSTIVNWQSPMLFIMAGMMAVGLLFSYSRGAWLGTTVGLLRLAKSYGTLKWHHILPGIFVLVVGAWCFWDATPDSAPWYLKRMDFGRASAQHRLAAWKAGLEIMRDNPFGVGWNNSVKVYQNNYSPPEDGAMAITTNDYLMLGTQLGWAGLGCFVSYVGLCLRGNRVMPLRAYSLVSKASCGSGQEKCSPPEVPSARRLGTAVSGYPVNAGSMQRVACRAGAIVMLVGFWFDGGLFNLATASVFWVLLELGAEDSSNKVIRAKRSTKSHPA